MSMSILFADSQLLCEHSFKSIDLSIHILARGTFLDQHGILFQEQTPVDRVVHWVMANRHRYGGGIWLPEQVLSRRDRRGGRAGERRLERGAGDFGTLPPGAERGDVHGGELVLSGGLPGRAARQQGQEHSKGLSPFALCAGHRGKCVYLDLKKTF